ncbi:MAG TPA: NAD(P)-dependent oxidoreductase [Aestuariivirga sp.]|nr:NAD(P)-dependent oxidoreductase [Aestuariivirga sp.]
MRIGFIGAGLMGHGMALNLLEAGHEVSVIAHRNRAPIEDLVSNGAGEAKSLGEIAQASDFIFLCLSSSKIVEDTVLSMERSLRKGQIIIDAGTSEPETTRRLASQLAELGVGYADAPLTGGPEQAASGQLGVFCGASPEVFLTLRPLFSCFATIIRHIGPVGSGHTAKLISNYLVTGMIALVAEAFGTARRANIDWRDLYEVMLNGSGNSGVLRKMVAPVLDGNFEGYKFSLANAYKDIGYFKTLAIDLNLETSLVEAVEAVFSATMVEGLGEMNVSHLLEL